MKKRRPDKTPQLYTGIVLHDYDDWQDWHAKYPLPPCSRDNFVKSVDRRFDNVFGVIPFYELAAAAASNKVAYVNMPEEVELHDGAEFVVDTRSTDRIENVGKRVGRLLHLPQLAESLKKHAKREGHTNVKAACEMRVDSSSDNKYLVLDAVAIADSCIFVGVYEEKMTYNGASKLQVTVDFIEGPNFFGEGNVREFLGKTIVGVLAGGVETTDTADKIKMDEVVNSRGFLKWFEGVDFDGPSQPTTLSSSSAPPVAGPDASSPGTSGTTTTPAAVLPRRVRQVAIPMRRAQVQVRPRLAPKFGAGFRLSSLI